MAPDRIVPVLRPYRQPGELSSWHQDPTVVPYLEQRLARPIYRGIGEFHLTGADARSPVVRQVAELAGRHGLFLHCHCDAEAAEILVGLVPGVRVLWAHAGMSSGPDEVGRLVGASADLLVELALRSDVAPGGQLDPAWRDLFVRHADRFMVGTDTWVAVALGRLRRGPERRPHLAPPAPARRGAPPGDRERRVARAPRPLSPRRRRRPVNDPRPAPGGDQRPMIRYAANLTMLFNEVPFLERFERAAAAGFRAVEFLFIHTVDAGAVERELERHGLELVLFDPEGGDFAAGDRGYLCDPARRDHLLTTIQDAVAVARRVGCRRLNVLAGNRPPGVSRARSCGARRWRT